MHRLGRRSDIILVVVVAFKELLDTVTAQLCLTLLHCLCVLPLLVVHMVLVEIVNINVWNILRLHLSACQSTPIKVIEPGVRLKLLRASIVANSVNRFSLQTLVNEVSCFFVPPLGDTILLYLHLATENLVSDIFARAAFVGPLTHHALVSDHAHSEIVSSQAMVLPAHHFWGHVAWRPTGFTRVIRRQNPCDAEVSEAEVALVIKDEILRFDVPVNNQLRMHRLQCVNQACDKEPSDLHREFPLTSYVIAEISTQEEVHDEV